MVKPVFRIIEQIPCHKSTDDVVIDITNIQDVFAKYKGSVWARNGEQVMIQIWNKFLLYYRYSLNARWVIFLHAWVQ